jgi:predicted ATPase
MLLIQKKWCDYEMYKLESIEISGFWGKYKAACNFNHDVNIIIGRNGTGKTTFMNILHAVFSVDLEALADNIFEEVVVVLKDIDSKKKISVKRNDDYFQPVAEYKISTKKYQVKLFSAEDSHRLPVGYKRRAQEESSLLRAQLKTLIDLSSLSVYRLRSGEDYEIKDKSGRRLVSSVDFRLNQLMEELTHYQLKLSNEARKTSNKLQKEVLTSILYSDRKEKLNAGFSDFDKETETQRLISAYKQLGVIDVDVKKKISNHISEVDKVIEKINERKGIVGQFGALEAYIRTQEIIRMSLTAEEETKEIYKQKELYLSIIKDFIIDKDFSLGDDGGGLIVRSSLTGLVPIEKLSSGEKQLLILLTEALLQNEKTCVYLADEPELSLHIEWQRKIIPAIKKLNNNAQVIAATHSPEVAANYKKSMINMKDIVI